MRLWIDDVRPMPGGYGMWAKTAKEAIAYLMNGIIAVTHISFDHDLGAPENGTGYDVACWIERWLFEHHNLPRLTWEIHSANPVGRENIQRAMESAERIWDDLEKNHIIQLFKIGHVLVSDEHYQPKPTRIVAYHGNDSFIYLDHGTIVGDIYEYQSGDCLNPIVITRQANPGDERATGLPRINSFGRILFAFKPITI